MNMIPVTSSNLESVGYEYDTLYIRFNKGGLYAYYNVPVDVYNALLQAPSKGKFFHVYIKNIYRYRKIG